MKVEKCPVCKREMICDGRWYPLFDGKSYRFIRAIHMFQVYHEDEDGSCVVFFRGKTRLGTLMRYNRWARREAKRIAKEGK